MSFQAYIDNITLKTGKTPEDIFKLAKKADIILPEEFELGHGHCMALWALFVSKGWVETKNTKLSK
jgi:Domain of unknown function (DUF4287)